MPETVTLPPLLAEGLADDLQQLIRLHDCELDEPLWAALQSVKFPEGLSLIDVASGSSAQLMQHALAEDFRADFLAAEFAAIYLTAALGASPYESVWVTDEHLTAQQPMFEWKHIFQQEGLKVDNPQHRYDDHLVLQLTWLHIKLSQSQTSEVDWCALLPIIDQHLMYWLDDWQQKVVARSCEAFYVALARLTWDWLTALRALLTDLTGIAMPTRAEIAEIIRAKLKTEGETVLPIHFMPGKDGPSW